MGQYYVVANLDKREFLYPRHFGSGVKLLEFGSDGQSVMTGLAVLLAESNGRGGGDLNGDPEVIDKVAGRWAGDRIIVAGDYADEGEIGWNVYSDCGSESNGWEDISEEVVLAMCECRYLAESLGRREVVEKSPVQGAVQP
jgi:hypothetical protein